MIPVGSLAPDFEALDQAGASVHLRDLRTAGPVVLVFYPADETRICTRQLCAIRDDWSKFQQRGATVLGINPARVERHARFAASHGFPFPVLSDQKSAIARAYRASGFVFNKRTVYVIGRDGRVLLAGRGVVSHDEIFAALDRAKAG